MRLVDGLNYREWQKKNTQEFTGLDKAQQKEARQKGYRNLGWDKVVASWEILCQFHSQVVSKVTTMFEHRLNKGDIAGAIKIALIDADLAKELAQEAIKSNEETQAKIDKLTADCLAKYQPLNYQPCQR